ncbi:MAG: TRAP transporter large permease subunit [Alphaproteobacteria bacterium]|nr:TRAP transporter large permease subunit [Alphaproteobacteria bacterium]MCY4499851.1 TRAP transporter large permease subunit [Rhodospirillaceae bacterium]
MSSETLGLVSLAALFIGICVGFPISFTLIFLGIVFGVIGFGAPVFYLMVLHAFQVMSEPLFAAVPLFLFMGYLLEQAGLMNRLFNGFRLLLAGIRGSLYIAVLATATLFAAATGVVGASVTILGVMAGPVMEKSGYSIRLSAGAIAAGGTLGMLIPPSVMLVVMGPIVGVPITDLFAAAVMPGLVLAGLYTAYALVRSYINPALGPALPVEERAKSVLEMVRELFFGIIPLAVLILAVLGSILGGLATPTDAAAMGAFGAFVLTVLYRRFTLEGLKQAAYRTIITSSMVSILVVGSNLYSAVFSRLGTATMIAESLLGLNFNPMVILLTLLGFIFVLGWPLEWVPIVIIIVPIVLPLVKALGIDILWFCTLVAVCLQTAWLSPPVALSAYYIKGVVPNWELSDIYAGMIQFMLIQLIGLSCLLMFPQLALWLPEVLFG